MSNTNPLLLVRDFTLAFGQEWKDQPGLPAPRTAMLRVQLVMEEIGELAHALAACDKVEAVDALTDIDYVTYGCMGAFGVHGLESHAPSPASVLPRAWGTLDMSGQLVVFHEIAKLANIATMGMSMAFVEGNEHQSRNGLQSLAFALPLLLQATANAWSALGLMPYREAAFLEVQRANMSKLGEDGKPILNEAGRVVKGPNYVAPDLARVVAEIDNQLALEVALAKSTEEEEIAHGNA